ncbi:hypothetical protein ACWCQV_41065, partial [Streptomyces eurythermus]
MVSIPAQSPPQPPSGTHDVTNQPPPLAPYDASDDPALLEGLRREGAGWAEENLRRLGARAGSAQAQEWGELANRYEPVLRTHDRYGHRVDEVDFHPAWHHLMPPPPAISTASSSACTPTRCSWRGRTAPRRP